MKKIIFSMTALLVLPLTVLAGPRSLNEIKAAARKAIPTSQTSARSTSGGELKVLKVMNQLTVLGYDNGGFAVIANDDSFAPVLGYSDKKAGDNLPPAMQWWLEAANASLEAQLDKGVQTRAASDIPEGYEKSVAPLLTTTWGQEEPYNALTPVYTSDAGETHYYTGCVATAMAQIMNYYESPVKGKGSSSYMFTPPAGQGSQQMLYANYGNTVYDWDNMLDSYTGTYSEANATAVSTLMYHCGVSVQMQYNETGSGARSVDACNALRNYFGYDENIKLYNRSVTPVKEWMSIVYRELNDHCPILYSGMRADGFGHSFVLDGYDEDGLVHVNWGWEGESDGYFNIAPLNGFSNQQEMVVVRLADDNRYNETYKSRWGCNGALTMSVTGTNISIALLSSQSGFFNACADNFSGVVSVVAENMEDGTITALSSSLDNIMPQKDVVYSYGFTLTDGALLASFGRLMDGQYRIYFASKDEKESEWQPVLSSEYNNNNYIFTLDTSQGINATITPGDPQWTTGVENVVAADNTDDGMARVYTASGVEVYAAPAASFSIDDVPATGLLIVKKGGETTKVMKK